MVGHAERRQPLGLAVEAAARDAAARLARAQEQVTARAQAAREHADELAQEIAELESGVHPTPPARYAVAADARAHRAGAPLWQLVDFRDDVCAEDRAGIEAALEAAGILDGWVTAVDGEVAGPRLADVLVPGVEGRAGIGATEVQGLLTAIGLGEGGAPVWVSPAGRFQNGLLRGAWHKPDATFIGHTAREAARRARLAELHERADAIHAELDAFAQELEQLTRRHALLERELAELPADAPVRDGDAALAVVEAELITLAARLEEARKRERQAHTDEQTAREVLRTDAEDLGLPDQSEELAQAGVALTTLRETLAALWPAQERRRRAEPGARPRHRRRGGGAV